MPKRWKERPSAFLSVSLGVLQQDPRVQQELENIVNEFLHTTGWQPAMTQNVAGALLYTKVQLGSSVQS